MNLSLFLIGLACVIAAIVGGGLTMAGVTIPPLASRLRQALLALAGGVVIVLSFLLAGGGDSGATTADQAAQPTTAAPYTVPSGGFPAGEVGIRLSASGGPPGTTLQVSGSGFQPGETVDIRFHTQSIGETRTDIDGAFSTLDVRVPADWAFKGQFDIVATGRQSSKSARAPFQVK